MSRPTPEELRELRHQSAGGCAQCGEVPPDCDCDEHAERLRELDDNGVR